MNFFVLFVAEINALFPPNQYPDAYDTARKAANKAGDDRKRFQLRKKKLFKDLNQNE